MSKAPETIYIRGPYSPSEPSQYFTQRVDGSEIAYVLGAVAYGYASEVERLRAALRRIGSVVNPTNAGYEMRRIANAALDSSLRSAGSDPCDALTKEG